MTDTQQNIYKVVFHNQGHIYEVYAHNIYQSDLYGFIEVEDYIFGSRSKLVVDPGEDKLRSEFDDAELVAQTLWAGMHGVASLYIIKENVDWIEWRGIAMASQAMSDMLLGGLLKERP